MNKKNLRICLVLAIAFVSLAVMAISQFPSPATAENSAGLLPGQIVYFATTKPTNLPFSPTDFQVQGVRVTNDLNLKKSLVTSNTRAIMFDHHTWPLVDGDWLKDQYRKGVTVVGLNVNMNELLTVLPPPVRPANLPPLVWGDYPLTKPHYAMISERWETNGRHCFGESQDHFGGVPAQGFINKILGASQPCGTR